MDLRPTLHLTLRTAPSPAMAFAVARHESTSWSTAHQVLVDHQPIQHWWRTICSVCGVRFPCPMRELALDELTGAAR